MSYIEMLNDEMNRTKTFNDANALLSTHSSLVDLFGVIGALRERSDKSIELMFSKALAENEQLAMKILFYARDIRGGLGERSVSRVIMSYLSKFHPKIMKRNLHLVAHYGRWDDLLCMLESCLYKDIIEMIRMQLENDLISETPSLLAKWLPSINTSSRLTRDDAKLITKGLNWHAKKYRKTLSILRRKIDVLEVKMSHNEWDQIKYSTVPSVAMNRLSNAFHKHDDKRFSAYMSRVKSGDETIHAGTLYPYDIIEKMLYRSEECHLDVLEEQWKAMPDYVKNNTRNTLVMADVSGSMYGRPMATAIGLAIYFAQRTQGHFRHHYMTFSESPQLLKVTKGSLYDQVNMVLHSDWGMSTNFEKALSMLLKIGIKNNLPQSEMPESLIVVSDMQFNESSKQENCDWTFYEKMKHMYESEGYKIPEIIFWNVHSLTNVFQVTEAYEGVKLASGQSASVFEAIMNSKAYTPYDFMMEVLSQKRYDLVA